METNPQSLSLDESAVGKSQGDLFRGGNRTGLEYTILNFLTGQTVFRILFHCMDMKISGRPSHQFHVQFIAHCVSFAGMRQKEIKKIQGGNLRISGLL